MTKRRGLLGGKRRSGNLGGLTKSSRRAGKNGFGLPKVKK